MHDSRGILIGNGKFFDGAGDGVTKSLGEFGEGHPCEEWILLGVVEEFGEEGEGETGKDGPTITRSEK